MMASSITTLTGNQVAYHYPQGTSGLESQYPEKRFDDAIDPLRAIADRFFLRSALMTTRRNSKPGCRTG
jgi:hypothetical protein